MRARQRRLLTEPYVRGRCFIFSPKMPSYQQPAPTTAPAAEAARQSNAATAVADTTSNGRQSTNVGGQAIAYAQAQDDQRNLMKQKRTSSAAADLGTL